MQSNRRKSGMGCSAVGCSMRSNTNLLSKVKMFRFPKDTVRRAAWCNAMKRENWTPPKNIFICNAHFITGMPNSDPQHPDYVPSIFSFKKMTVEEGEKKLRRYERNIKRGKHDLLNRNSDEDNIPYPEQGLLLKERFRLRSTAVPSLRLPEALPENSKNSEVKRLQIVKKNSLDTECMKSGLHQEDAIKLSNGDSPEGKKNCSNYLDSDVKKMSEMEPILLDDNMKNKHHISMEMSDSERITDSEEDSEYSLQETIFDPGSFPSSTDNVEEVLTQKLELVTGLYERSWKKMKFYQKKCKLYAKQSIALKEVIESLKQINSVPNDL